MNQRILSVITAASLLISLSACSSTHEARLPSDCNITSLKKLLPTLDLMYKDKPGNSKFLECSTTPLDKRPSDSDITLSQWKKGTSIWYSKGNEGGFTEAEIAKYGLEVENRNGCRVITYQSAADWRLDTLAMCEGFVIVIWMPKGTPWSFGAELASAAIVGLIQ